MNTINQNILSNEMFSTLDCIFKDITFDRSPEILKDIINKYRNNFKNENVLCMNDYMQPVTSILKNIGNPLNMLFSQGFSSKNRQDVEIFSSHIQLVTAVMIHDDENMLLLNNLYSNKVYQRGTLSFVQGHVEFPENITLTLGEVLRRNMIKEMSEELGTFLDSESIFSTITRPVTAIYLPVPPSTNKHCCVLFELKVDNVNDFYCKENDQSGLISIKLNQIHTQYNYLCPWVLQSLSEFECVKRAYLQYLEKTCL